jgi:hypothetical protein
VTLSRKNECPKKKIHFQRRTRPSTAPKPHPAHIPSFTLQPEESVIRNRRFEGLEAIHALTQDMLDTVQQLEAKASAPKRDDVQSHPRHAAASPDLELRRARLFKAIFRWLSGGTADQSFTEEDIRPDSSLELVVRSMAILQTHQAVQRLVQTLRATDGI